MTEDNHKQTLITLFDQAVAAHPEAPAVTDSNVTLTYAELRQQALAASGALIPEVGNGRAIAIDIPRGVDYLIAVLATLYAGGHYVPLDSAASERRKEVLLHQLDRPLRLRALPPAQQPAQNPAAPEAVACVLFTSGTTGVPKGIRLTHHNMAWFAGNGSIPQLGPGDRAIQMSSPDFDTFTFEVWRTLATGAELVVTKSLPELVAAGLGSQLRRNKITSMLCPAAVLNSIAESDPDAFNGLRVLCSGGDVLLPATYRRLIEGGFTGTMMNLYGPTETTVACAGHVVCETDTDTVPIGTPLEGAQITLVDPDSGQPVQGEQGVMEIRGAGVGIGYLSGDRDGGFATAEPDGYNSGDMAVRLPDGSLDFRGRADTQVKVDGVRVDLVSIEQALAAGGASSAAVFATGEPGARRLVALVVAGAEFDSLPALRKRLGETLPRQAVPHDMRLIERMPTDEHGKRDLKQLRQTYEQSQLGRTVVPPRHDLDRELIAIWEELLGVENVSISDDFFALGGHSLLAVRQRSRIRKTWGVQLAPEEMFECTVLQDIADKIQYASKAAS